MILVVRLKLKSLNDLKGRHWARRHQEKNDAAWALKEAGARRTTPPEHRQLVTLTRVLGPRERVWDFENLTGGTAKAIFDALTDLGYWRDDSPRWIDRAYEQDALQRQNGPAVEIRIEVLS